jgi:hypothetical protein
VWFSNTSDSGLPEITASQSFEDFIHYGPVNDNIPAETLVELYEVIFNATDNVIEM